MNKLIYLFFIITLILFSCDGRYRIYKNKSDILKDTSLLNDVLQRDVYIPSEPLEIITDTLISKDLKVIVSYSSFHNNFVLQQEKNENGLRINTYYRNFEAKIQIYHNGTLPSIRKTINKSNFTTNANSRFWANAIMQYVWVDEFSSSSNTVHLNVSFCTPNTKWCRDFKLIIDAEGNMKAREIDLSKQQI